MNKHSLATDFIILFFVILGLLLCSSAIAGAPKAVFPTTSFSFGDIKQGSPLVHTFSVINRGDAPLKIERVRPG